MNEENIKVIVQSFEEIQRLCDVIDKKLEDSGIHCKADSIIVK